MNDTGRKAEPSTKRLLDLFVAKAALPWAIIVPGSM